MGRLDCFACSIADLILRNPTKQNGHTDDDVISTSSGILVIEVDIVRLSEERNRVVIAKKFD